MNTPSNKRCCPHNGLSYSAVSIETVRHHLKKPLADTLTGQHYFFCDSPDCDVVYFGDDDSVLLNTDMQTPVGQKHRAADNILCYCYGISYGQVHREISEHGKSSSREFVTEKTKSGTCQCRMLNPSGKCCLKDFPE